MKANEDNESGVLNRLKPTTNRWPKTHKTLDFCQFFCRGRDAWANTPVTIKPIKNEQIKKQIPAEPVRICPGPNMVGIVPLLRLS